MHAKHKISSGSQILAQGSGRLSLVKAQNIQWKIKTGKGRAKAKLILTQQRGELNGSVIKPDFIRFQQRGKLILWRRKTTTTWILNDKVNINITAAPMVLPPYLFFIWRFVVHFRTVWRHIWKDGSSITQKMQGFAVLTRVIMQPKWKWCSSHNCSLWYQVTNSEADYWFDRKLPTISQHNNGIFSASCLDEQLASRTQNTVKWLEI